MIITPIVDRTDPKSVIAIIDGMACFFKRGTPQPPSGQKVEVMVCGAIRRRDGYGHWRNHEHPRHLLLRTITPEDVPVRFNGFEMTGGMCATLSSATRLDTGERIVMVSPGRCGIRYAENVNIGWNGKVAEKLIPGMGWVNMRPEGGKIPRLEGFDDHTQLLGWGTISGDKP